jgi:DNA-binding HxlR family transcriptional regulator
LERKPRVYWFKEKKGKKDILIFDAANEWGSIYVYQLKDMLPATHLDNEIKK